MRSVIHAVASAGLLVGLFLSSSPCDAFTIAPHQTRLLDGLKTSKISNIAVAHPRLNIKASPLFMTTPRGSSVSEQKAKFAAFMKRFRTSAISLVFAAFLFFSAGGMANASTGGRMGGSFGRSSSGRSSYSRSLPSRSSYSSPSRSYSSQSPVIIQSRRPPPVYYYGRNSSPLYYQNSAVSRGGGSGVADVIITGSVVGFIVWKTRGPRDHDISRGGGGTTTSALGPGVSVASLTVAIEVPNRTDGDNILSRIQKLSKTAQTSTRKGVQDLINNVCLELLRQQSSMHSVTSYSKHYRDDSKAQRDFQRLSVEQRSKFDEETLNKFNDVDMSFEAASKTSSDDDAATGKATMAVITINVCIEGDEMKFPSTIKNRMSLTEVLGMMASQSQVDDCLLSAEVLWSPEDIQDRLMIEEVYAKYPDLYPL